MTDLASTTITNKHELEGGNVLSSSHFVLLCVLISCQGEKGVTAKSSSDVNAWKWGLVDQASVVCKAERPRAWSDSQSIKGDTGRMVLVLGGQYLAAW